MTPDHALAYAEKIFEMAESEPGYRNAAGRYYYAVFWRLLEHPACAGFDRTQRDVHKRLIEYLINHEDPALGKMARRCLAPLRALRNEADYVRTMDFTRGFAKDAAEYSAEIVHDYLPAASH